MYTQFVLLQHFYNSKNGIIHLMDSVNTLIEIESISALQCNVIALHHPSIII